jgi:drug/metabolite transporter (DMT)-like permease
MKEKWTLFTGIILLTAGIVLRKITDFGIEAILLIVAGVIFKVYYLIRKARNGEYKPGLELVFLFIGLIMFFSGLYLRYHEPPFNPLWLIIPGISLKVVFIILFIRKIRKSRKTLFR